MLEPFQSHLQNKARADRLTFLLNKSTIYAKIIGDRMERQQIEKRKAEARAATRKENKEKKSDVGATRGSTREKKKVEPEPAAEKAGSKRKRRGDKADKEDGEMKPEAGDEVRRIVVKAAAS